MNYRWQKRILKTSSINYLLKLIKNIMKEKKEKKRWPLLSTIWKVLNPRDVSILGRGVHLLLGVHPIGSCPLTGGVQLTRGSAVMKQKMEDVSLKMSLFVLCGQFKCP